MVIGAFFSEVGNTLLVYFSDFDVRLEKIKGDLVVKGDWTDAQFREVADRIRGYDYQVDAARIDFEHLRAFLAGRRAFCCGCWRTRRSWSTRSSPTCCSRSST